MSHVTNNGVNGRTAGVRLAVGVADAATAAGTILAGQRYLVTSTIDCYLRVGAAAVTTGASVPILAKLPYEMMFARAGEANPIVHGITAAGAGSVDFSPVEGC